MKNSEKEHHFIADRMLGRLARYLRLIGYDVSYPPTCPDAKLIGTARSEKRVLLTRDRGILDQESALKGRPEVVEISSVEVLDQIAQLAEEGWISRILAPRCALCNSPLLELDVDEARHLLPPYVLATQCSFLCCVSCNIILWKGSHWKHFRRSISQILQAPH